MINQYTQAADEILKEFKNRAPMAQLVEHRVVMREVVSSTPVLK